MNKTIFKSPGFSITFCSASFAETIKPDSKMALIAIRGQDESNNINYSVWTNKLLLEFDDLTRKHEDSDALFSDKHAEKLIEFVQGLPDTVNHIVIHCLAGVSRSGAVAKFLSGTVYPECKDEQFDREYTLYNARVYKTLARVWKRIL